MSHRLPNGQSKKIIFAILAGNSLEELRKVAQQATLMANPRSPKGTKPIVPAFLCKDKTMQVKPQNGTKFRFYEENNLQEPKIEGSEMTVALADTSKVFYISNIDSLLESDLLKYQFKAHQAKASFQSIDSLNIVDSSWVYFYDKSSKAVKWSWDFGDNTALDTLKNPKHRYAQVGTYKVVLTITDSVGCQANFSKNIKVVRLARSPLPNINPSEVYACRTAPVVITPSNGRNFRYYASMGGQPLGTGRSFRLTDLTLRQVYITSIDSAFESAPVTLTIRRGNLTANFDYTPKADTLLNSPINFTDLSTSSLSINKWEWDMGDGSPIKADKNVSHRFNKQGVYRILLKVSDFSGCTDTISKIFRVGSKAPKPSVAGRIVCEGQTATLAPTGGTKFNFYTSLPLRTPISQGSSYSFTPSKTQLFYITCTDSIVESDYQSVLIEVNVPMADFDSPNEILLYRANNIANFKDLSKNAVAWSWNFGDGSPVSTIRNPNYLYKKQGEYTVTLTIRDIYGCSATASKKIKAVNRANPPNLSNIMICKNTEVTLMPAGGSKFRFYEMFPSSIVAFTGNSWSLGKVSTSKTYYVTNIDSLHESEASKVEVKVDEINATFEAKTSGNEVFAGDTIYFKALAESANSWEWFFGDGTSSYEINPTHIYQNAGNYSLTLNTRNPTGCTASVTKAFAVKAKTMIPPNVQIYLYPNPTEGEVRVEVNTNKLTPVYIEVYNNLGQKIIALTKEMVRNEIYEFSLKGREKGLYIMRFTFNGETYIRKVVYL
jgi:PKD repeat protein